MTDWPSRVVSDLGIIGLSAWASWVLNCGLVVELVLDLLLDVTELVIMYPRAILDSWISGLKCFVLDRDLV